MQNSFFPYRTREAGRLRRYLPGLLSWAAWVVSIVVACSGTGNAADKSAAMLGGDTTVHAVNRHAFAQPAPNLSPEKLRTFFFGNRLFNTNWVIAPASVKSLDGLGPTYNRVSCSGCHLRDGRGRPPRPGEKRILSMLIRLSIPGKGQHGGPKPHPHYGDQLNDRAIPGVPAEGRAVITYASKTTKFADGENSELRMPRYEIREMAFGPLGREVMLSPRVAPAVFGLGLLDAVSEKTILGFADAQKREGKGISGRPNYVWDHTKKKTRIGRFGWKANQPSLIQQNASALIGDIGITSNMFPRENCPGAQGACRSQPTGEDPQISREFLEKMTLHTRVLGVPSRRNLNDPQVLRGEKLFREAGCASCHVERIVTGRHPEMPELSHQTIHPYTDLLLHDMGDGLADGRPDYLATGSEWRTPPLWGIGLVRMVNKHTFFMHDGRARNLKEAILWHGGEAEKSQEIFLRMSKPDRDSLIKFLESL